MRRPRLTATYSAGSEGLGVSQNKMFGKCTHFLITRETPISQKIVRSVSESCNRYGTYKFSHARQDL